MYTIRTLHPSEHDFLKEMLYESIFIEESKKPSVEELLNSKELLKYHVNWGMQGDRALVAVSEEDEKLGAVWYRLLQGEKAGYDYVDDLTPELGIVLTKEARGKGVGRALMVQIMKQARDDQFKALSLSVDPENEAAVELYMSLGFAQVGMEGTSLTMVVQLEEGERIQQFRELEESHLQPDVRKSPEKLNLILADAFLEFGSSGKAFGKKKCLEEGISQDIMVMHQFKCNLVTDDVVLTTYHIHNRTKDQWTLRSSVWKQIEGRWQLYFHQGTFRDETKNK
ncbi:GNAT family N-acetyltransferase [Alkalicoccobacillus gibsonii]|uniref:GNAT family N-acetyltransferase n=1 Tax=Alkalicoccobacillus gibsonii TaxID=79881 RepID=UPI001FE292EA|nr:GNAT family N-acetyltransferase [Alkalicoccobacillus gibsonii]